MHTILLFVVVCFCFLDEYFVVLAVFVVLSLSFLFCFLACWPDLSVCAFCFMIAVFSNIFFIHPNN